jgi:hypothetical protein
MVREEEYFKKLQEIIGETKSADMSKVLSGLISYQ